MVQGSPPSVVGITTTTGASEKEPEKVMDSHFLPVVMTNVPTSMLVGAVVVVVVVVVAVVVVAVVDVVDTVVVVVVALVVVSVVTLVVVVVALVVVAVVAVVDVSVVTLVVVVVALVVVTVVAVVDVVVTGVVVVVALVVVVVTLVVVVVVVVVGLKNPADTAKIPAASLTWLRSRSTLSSSSTTSLTLVFERDFNRNQPPLLPLRLILLATTKGELVGKPAPTKPKPTLCAELSHPRNTGAVASEENVTTPPGTGAGKAPGPASMPIHPMVSSLVTLPYL